MIIRIGPKLFVDSANLKAGTLITTPKKKSAHNFYSKIASGVLALAKKLHKGEKIEGIDAPFNRATGPRGPRKSKPTSRKLASTGPKRRGRPPGSKNKSTLASEGPKRRGRPPGSKNKAA